MTSNVRKPPPWGSLGSIRGGLPLLLATLFFAAASPVRAEPAATEAATHVRDLTGGFVAPTDVAVDAAGRVYVLDGVNLRVVVFDANGTRVATREGVGTAGEDGDRPTGLAVSGGGRIYVADPGGHCVRVLGGGGGDAVWALPAGAEGPSNPTDVVLDEGGGHAYVLDNDNHRVHVLDLASGRVAASFGANGSGRRQFLYPYLGAFDAARGRLLVVEVLNARVQLLDRGGGFVGFVGSFGVDRGHFYRPKGVAVDGTGRIYVSDGYQGAIQVFGPDGTFQAALHEGDKGALLRVRGASGLATDGKGLLYVVETTRDRVGVYRLGPRS